MADRNELLGSDLVGETMSGTWSEESVGGHPCDIYEPSQRNEHGFVLIYLHGVHLGRLQDKMAFVEQFEKHGLPVVAPMTRRSWWVDRICPEFDSNITPERHLLENVFPFVEARYETHSPRIGLWGTSMGGQGALRIAYKRPQQFPVVAAISPALDFQSRVRQGDEVLSQMYSDPEAARQDTAILYIHPLNWPRHQFFCCDPTDADWWDSADRLRMKLHSLGVPFECDLETIAGGHGFGYYEHQAEKAIGFLAERLFVDRNRIQ